jgi:hypothetical protein
MYQHRKKDPSRIFKIEIVPRTLCIYVDNMAVVRGTSNTTYKSNSQHTLTPEWDLLHLIPKLKKALPIRTTTHMMGKGTPR